MAENKRYQVVLKFFTEVLGSAPNSDTYSKYIATKTAKDTGDELKLAPQDREESGWTAFRSDENGLLVMDYQILGYLKEAADAITGQEKNGDGKRAIPALKSKLERYVFVDQRVVPFTRDGQRLIKPDGVLERPLRAMTMQGPRVTLVKSDKLNPGVELSFGLTVLTQGESVFTAKRLNEWFEYGQYKGMGQWRNGGFGRFVYAMAEVQ